MNFIDDEVAMKQIDLLNIGTEYKILADTDKYTAFSYIDLSQTCIGVLKIFKDKNHYLLHLFTALDFSLFNMYIEYMFTIYQSKIKVLTIFFINRHSNSLILQRIEFDFDIFTQKKLVTVKDQIDLTGISKFIWKIQCRNQM